MGSRNFTRYAWGVFGYGLLVILWGYFLRISRSGDGCGTDWPLCHGALVPAAPPFPTIVEWVHRASSGVVLLLVVGMAIWAFRAFPRGNLVRFAAAATLVFTITESLFGALLVVFGLVAEDASLARILIRPFHVTNTFLLMGALALTPWWAWRGAPRRIRWQGPERGLLLAGVGAVLLLGWTGSWTGLANAAFPADSLRGGLGQYMDPEHLLIYLRMAHPVVALPAIGFLAWLGMRLARGRGGERGRGPANPVLSRLGGALALAAALQLAVGPLAVLLREAVGVRLLHLLLADAAWILLLLAGATLLGVGGAEEGRASSPRRAPGTPSDRAPTGTPFSAG